MERWSSSPADFWKFWFGQSISAGGTSVTSFVLPLVVYGLTGSAIDLALVTAATYVPYILFGLLLGAWLDRVDRKAVMISTDLARAILAASVAVLFYVGFLSVWWIYFVVFATSTLTIAFNAGSFAAVPSLIPDRDDLVLANGRLQAGFSTAWLVGPLLAGVLLAVIPAPALLLADSASFLLSAGSLLLIRRSFNAERVRPSTSIGRGVVEGLAYVVRHPLLRSLAIMAALINIFFVNTFSQIVLLAKIRLDANNSQIAWLYAAAAAGAIILSFAVPYLRRHFSFSQLVLGTMLANGILTIALSLTQSLWVALPIWAGVIGTATLFGINTASLRQSITPDGMLGRVGSSAQVLAWSMEPFGALAGGFAIQRTGNVALVYAVVGAAIFIVTVCFGFSPIRNADRYAIESKTITD